MANSLREVIAKRLASSQPSQNQTPVPTPVPTLKVEVPEEVKGLDDEEFDDDSELDDDEVPVAQTPVEDKKVASEVAEPVSDEDKAQAEIQENAQRIMMLQDNGIFRIELLHQLNEIKRALTIIANIGIELTKEDKADDKA